MTNSRSIDGRTVTSATRNIVTGCSRIALAASAALCVIAAAGAISSTLDQINNAAPAWLLVGLAAGGRLIVSGRADRSTLALTGLVLATACVMVVPDLARGLARPSGEAGELKIISFNVWKENPDPARLADWLDEQKADVMMLYEVSPRLHDMLSRRYPEHVSCAPGGTCSTMIYSRSPVLDAGGLADGGDPEKRMALSGAWIRVATAGAPITILGLHLNHPYPLGNGHDQMPEIVRFISGVDRSRLIVAGDMNRTPWSFAIMDVDEALGIDRVTHAMMTWPANSVLPAMFGIDHMYAGRDIVIDTLGTGPGVGSDHRPIIAEVSLRQDR